MHCSRANTHRVAGQFCEKSGVPLVHIARRLRLHGATARGDWLSGMDAGLYGALWTAETGRFAGSMDTALLGIGWLLAGLGAYVRDLPQITNLVSHALLFLTPVFYEVSNIPAQYRSLLYANPLSVVIETARGLLLPGETPSLVPLAIYAGVSVVFALAALALFNWMRPRFADVV
jgi:ABC-2 type transporter